jgi:hypothetical protein
VPVRSFGDSSQIPAELDHRSIVGYPDRKALSRGRPKETRELTPIDADAEAWHGFEAELARLEQAVKGSDPWVDAALLDAGDRLLWDASLRRELALGQAIASPRVPNHSPRHRHLFSSVMT